MRTTKGTKYDPIDDLPPGAIPVSAYARENKIPNTSYVYVKYDRYRFGYKKGDGTPAIGEKPVYKIVDYKGMAYVVPADK